MGGTNLNKSPICDTDCKNEKTPYSASIIETPPDLFFDIAIWGFPFLGCRKSSRRGAYLPDAASSELFFFPASQPPTLLSSTPQKRGTYKTR
jgi:hypothetical protein